MEMLSYLLITVVAYLGAIGGYLLILAAPEEQKPGMKYFKAIADAIFLFAVLLAVLASADTGMLMIVLIATIGFLCVYTYRIYVAYLMFAFLFPLMADMRNTLLIMAVAVFAYGLVTGAMIIDMKDKKGSLVKVLLLLYFVLLANVIKLVL